MENAESGDRHDGRQRGAGSSTNRTSWRAPSAWSPREGPRRVTVAGIRFGEELLPEATRLARATGVEVRPVWGLGDAGCDIVVEAGE